MAKIILRLLFWCVIIHLFAGIMASCGDNQNQGSTLLEKIESVIEREPPDEYEPVTAMILLPGNPAPGERFRILATGGRKIRKAKIIVKSQSGELESVSYKTGNELPCWRIEYFDELKAGVYEAVLILDNKATDTLQFEIAPRKEVSVKNVVWKAVRGWNSGMETLYSAWVNALFQGNDEQASWSALHEVTQNKENNFLYNYLTLDEDNPAGKTRVIMEPDCADNPFYLRAYFSWKLGLPFGYHVCDRGYLGRNPQTGQWITNESSTSKSNPVLAFNSFVRRIMDGVHSGTARTSLDNENSDYYPVSLERKSLPPGTVFADPYGHTFVLVSWKPQKKDHPGQLLAVDAQPDNTIALKRFWKGNFLFSTAEVIGEPGFKAFRPILYENGKIRLMTNEELDTVAGYVNFSLQQRKMDSEDFYHTMDKLINPEPLDPGETLQNLIQALYEQLLVRVKSVANGEAYLQAHPGTVISMPASANSIFQAGGLWEDYSTPNRDLRLLIAMDEVLGFPDRIVKYPRDFNLSQSEAEDMKDKLQFLLEKKAAELKITYSRTNGSSQEISLAEILKRREAFEMAYNPNDGIEIRWGAPENSDERSTCRRQAPAYQQKTMQSVRKWFIHRLHPPT